VAGNAELTIELLAVFGIASHGRSHRLGLGRRGFGRRRGSGCRCGSRGGFIATAAGGEHKQGKQGNQGDEVEFTHEKQRSFQKNVL
jgi:hypothetical protein